MHIVNGGIVFSTPEWGLICQDSKVNQLLVLELWATEIWGRRIHPGVWLPEFSSQLCDFLANDLGNDLTSVPQSPPLQDQDYSAGILVCGED